VESELCMRRLTLGGFLMLSAPLGWQKALFYLCITTVLKFVFIVGSKLFFWQSCDPGVILHGENNSDLFLSDSQTREELSKTGELK
jgi:hypothetical protein